MRKQLLILALLCVLLGGFITGIGIAELIASKYKPKEYWLGSDYDNQITLEGLAEKTYWNELLIENMNCVSIEKELKVDGNSLLCEARIDNKEDNHFSCTVTIVRDSTGEILYQSKIIDPGYYIEYITLTSRLRKGWYPCTAVWSFYEVDKDMIIGETAQKIVVIINDGKK